MVNVIGNPLDYSKIGTGQLATSKFEKLRGKKQMTNLSEEEKKKQKTIQL